MKHAYVVHSDKTNEPFDPLTLHESVVLSCLTVRSPEGEAHSTAERVCRHVIDWLAPKSEVTCRDIRRVAGYHLATYHPEAAYMYRNKEIMI